MLKDFCDFIYQGNGIDLEIGVISGTSFTAIVNKLLGDMFVPLIGAMMGGINIGGMGIQVGDTCICCLIRLMLIS